MSKYFKVYSRSGGDRTMLGYPNAPWPKELFERYRGFAADKNDLKSELLFEEESEVEHAFLRELIPLRLQLRVRRHGKWNEHDIDTFPFYGLSVRDRSEGFEGDEIYEHQRPCPRTPNHHLSFGWGCGEGKRQFRKLRVTSPGKVRKSDIFMIFTKPVQSAGRVFGITRRFRDLLMAEGLTGFEVTPILDGSREWSSEQLAYDYVDEGQIKQAQWFQLSVTARTRQPFPVLRIENDKVCSACQRHNGWDEPDPRFSEWPSDVLGHTDMQICDERRLPHGEIVVNALHPVVLVSAKFVKVALDNSIRGLIVGGEPWGKFAPVVILGDK